MLTLFLHSNFIFPYLFKTDRSGTIDNQQICDIPNVMTIKQEIQEDYETYMYVDVSGLPYYVTSLIFFFF